MNHNSPSGLPEQEININTQGPAAGGSIGSIAASILVGSVLIAASILYQTKTLADKANPQAAANQPAVAVQNPTPSQQQVPTQPTGPISVNPRSDAPVEGN